MAESEKRLALTTAWKIHLAVLSVIVLGVAIWTVAQGGDYWLWLLPIAWALGLAAKAAGDRYFNERATWEEETGKRWTSHMNPLD